MLATVSYANASASYFLRNKHPFTFVIINKLNVINEQKWQHLLLHIATFDFPHKWSASAGRCFGSTGKKPAGQLYWILLAFSLHSFGRCFRWPPRFDGCALCEGHWWTPELTFHLATCCSASFLRLLLPSRCSPDLLHHIPAGWMLA